jgi:hypothetical protein
MAMQGILYTGGSGWWAGLLKKIKQNILSAQTATILVD